MSIQVLVYLIVIVLMLVDFITGTVNGISKMEFSSSKMREGLAHKFGSLVIVSLGFAIVLVAPVFAQYPEIAQLTGFDFASASVGFTIMGIVGIMELGSIIENACKLNPQLPMAKFLSAFGIEESAVGGTD